MKRILIADDDANIRDVIGFALEEAGYRTTFARNGAEALALARQRPPDLVVLDIGMPERDGLDVCATLRRESDVPIVFLSARGEEIDRVLGLELGGDDYVTKPFSPRELVARVGRILKRASPPTPAANVATHGALRIDRDARSVHIRDRPVDVTALEFAILSLLCARPSSVFTREQMMDGAWPPNVHVSDRTIDSHVRNIRAKLAAAGCADGIATSRGMGFRIGACTADA